MFFLNFLLLIIKAYSHHKIAYMSNAKNTLTLVICYIVLFTCHFCNNLQLGDGNTLSILYNDATFNDNFMLSPVPPF